MRLSGQSKSLIKNQLLKNSQPKSGILGKPLANSILIPLRWENPIYPN